MLSNVTTLHEFKFAFFVVVLLCVQGQAPSVQNGVGETHDSTASEGKPPPEVMFSA